MPLTEFILSSYYDSPVAWSGFLSTCKKDGAIIEFMKKTVDELPVNKRLIVPHADGFMETRNYVCFIKNLDDLYCASSPDDIVGALCLRNVTDKRVILMPFDDDSFELGVVGHMSHHSAPVPWEEKRPIAFWRGSPTGGFFPTVRYEVVNKSFGSSCLDARFVPRLDLDVLFKMQYLGYTFSIDDLQYWSYEETIQSHAYYKYILVVDGTCTASALQWVFASGSVPIVITHPGNNWWFKTHLKPMENYVPIEYDLSDLIEKIEWLIANDDKAQEIVAKALDLARTVLSSEFQKDYLRKEIQRVSEISNST
jgi:Glycosyl transferase family 90